MIEIHYKEREQPVANQRWLPSVHGVVLNDERAILLHTREDYSSWALPGGKLELGESLTDCLKREMFEETGLSVHAEKLLGIFSSPEYILSVKEKVFQPLLIVFLCKVDRGELTTSAESLSFIWMSRENMKDLETFPLVKEIANWALEDTKKAFFDTSCFIDSK